MSVVLNGITLLGEKEKEWNNRSGSKIAIGIKNGCKYQLKLYRSAPYPVKSMESSAAYERKIRACNELFSFRKEINAILKKADGGDHILGYAEETFLHTDLPSNGVIEIVPYVEGGQDYSNHRTEGWWMEKAFLQAAESVARMHDCGLLHTDIKPENMIFTCDGANDVHCTLIDFDKSCFVNHIPDDIGGTPGFQSPELIEILIEEEPDRIPNLLNNIGFYTDIFALGASYLVMLTGKGPTISKNTDNKWQVSWDHRSIHVPYLKLLIDAMLEPEPHKRPDIEAVVETLRTKAYVAKVQKCSLWEEHAERYEFNPKKASLIKRIIPEVYNGEKGYCVRFSEGSVRHYSLQLMINSFLLITKTGVRTDPVPNPIPRPLPDREGSGMLLPEDADKYVVNIDALNQRKWELMYDTKGYYYRTADGRDIRTNIAALLFFKIITKKE